MEKITLKVEDGGVRADKYIADNSGVSRARVAALFDEGHIFVNGKSENKPSLKLKAGDIVELELPQTREIELTAQDIPLDIVYEDESLLVINKPRGMVVHPAPGNEDGTLVNAVMAHCGDSLSGINGELRPGIVHRIDKDTTGLLVVAKNDDAHLKLSSQLEDRTLSRTYFALVHGNIREESGTVDAPIGRSDADRKKMAVTDKNSREAVTDFIVKERFGGQYTLVECHLRTGRTHQIRVHMKYIAHPIVGDKTYGAKKEEFNLDGQLLHAGGIGFIHPKSGREMYFTAPLPADFERILEILRNRYEEK